MGISQRQNLPNLCHPNISDSEIYACQAKKLKPRIRTAPSNFENLKQEPGARYCQPDSRQKRTQNLNSESKNLGSEKRINQQDLKNLPSEIPNLPSILGNWTHKQNSCPQKPDF
jgi:hypothetical protein